MRFWDVLRDAAESGGKSAKVDAVVEITNVEDYMQEHVKDMARDPSGGLAFANFPGAKCPWRTAFFEFANRHRNIREPIMSLAQEARRVGVYVNSYGADAPGFYSVLSAEGLSPKGAAYAHRLDIWLDLPASAPLWAAAVVSTHDERGAILDTAGVYDDEHLAGWMLVTASTVFMAMSFANCKNVATVDHRPHARVAAKRREAGKPVGVTYKTLIIDPMKEVLRTEGGIEKNGLKKALHICRGHFATYTPDKPLFGRLTGTFWKPMHVRGSKQRGEVRKDYLVLPKVD